MDEPDHELAEHSGIIRVSTDPLHASVDVVFDPALLSESDVRSLLKEHISQVESAIRKCTFRLEGNACEACAQKLEKKVGRIPGVRRATATYLGKVLSVTFDSDIEPEERIAGDLQKSGADIKPLAPHGADQRSLVQKILAGELNEEILLRGRPGVSHRLADRGKDGGNRTRSPTICSTSGPTFSPASKACARRSPRCASGCSMWTCSWCSRHSVPPSSALPSRARLLLFLFSFSNVLQRHAMERTQRAIEALLTLRPSEALVKRGGVTEKVAVETLEIGEIVIVRPGEQIPVDGVLSEGSTNVDESSLTGESMPVAKAIGSPIFAGTLNQSGGIELRVTKRSEDSTLSRMVKLVAEAQAEKSKTQRFLEKAEQYYAMGVIAFTIGVFLVPFLFQGATFAHAFYRAMTIMVVASPCALVISTPATVLSAIGGAARRGILIKGGSHLERAAHIDIVAIDKTGTLTVGKPSLTELVTADRDPPGFQPAAGRRHSAAARRRRA